jgi:hypothetical protein
MVSKNSPNGLSRSAALSSNNGARLLSTKSICRDFPEDSLLKFTGNFQCEDNRIGLYSHQEQAGKRKDSRHDCESDSDNAFDIVKGHPIAIKAKA